MQETTTRPEKPKFSAETKMEEAMRSDPNLSVTLMRFHIGGCSLCGFEPDDTIGRVAADNGVPTAVLLAAMNGEDGL
jgi:hypothetical protein